MTNITPPEHLPLELHTTGAITVEGHRFEPPGFLAFTKIWDLMAVFTEWLSDVAQEQRDLRAALPADPNELAEVLEDMTAEEREVLGGERRVAMREFNRIKRANDLEMKRRLSSNLIEALALADPDWTPPADPPIWFGTLGVLERIITHWETTPFHSLGQRRASQPGKPQQTSSREDENPGAL